ncbi:type III-B CRISPR module RAMP protein Cmr6 [Pyrobaculum ferrireducens]|uniref:CRISPR-associated RAMP protein, Cmr6 family n=1 Tax=Pyrobaculum ferrireducens TaxID=1104324 RepID=G7VBW2_9CREN|nr:type III-B CRISPR module RAMP protein Cmr6 [Pyrobaculum ferrireducens]AET32462.1 CRISPR-associated RAMP protein, Cmr6 family [Pyrobaculum ferrireducens]
MVRGAGKRRGGKSKKLEEEIIKIIRGALARLCSDSYNVVSCFNLAFLESMREAAGLGLKPPLFSREAVAYLYEKPPMYLRPDVVGRYVEAVMEAAKSVFRPVYRFEFTLETRLVIHTKWPYLPLEIGISWHPIFNIPYIPATSLKGALRATFPNSLCELDKTALFGEQSEEGKLTVFDAYPVKWEKLVEPDVITPHYKEVSGVIHEAAADPIPLVFPAIPPGVTFAFIIGVKSHGLGSECVTELFNAVRDALRLGVGAKTAIGYGIFK